MASKSSLVDYGKDHSSRRGKRSRSSKMRRLSSSSGEIAVGNAKEVKKSNRSDRDVGRRSKDIIDIYKCKHLEDKMRGDCRGGKNDKKYGKGEKIGEMGDIGKNSEELQKSDDDYYSSESSFEDPCPDVYRHCLGPTLDETLLVFYNTFTNLLKKFELFSFKPLCVKTTRRRMHKRKNYAVDLKLSLSHSSDS